MLFHKLDKFRDAGLLILRIGIGAAFVLHGYPKLMGGPEGWVGLGGSMASIGITFAPVFWGFMAAAAEFGGGVLLVLGLLTRPACFLLLMTMIVATVMHMKGGDPFKVYSHAFESAVLFFSLLLIGPGKFSVDEMLAKRS